METIRHFSKDSVIIMGDFNQKDIDWKQLQSESSKGQDFLDVINDLFLTQHVDQKTRGSNILDLVFSSEEGLVEDLEIYSPIPIVIIIVYCLKSV
jgi:endonuclease/exonuclease/phosphatase family metal-dependent hydrolase